MTKQKILEFAKQKGLDFDDRAILEDMLDQLIDSVPCEEKEERDHRHEYYQIVDGYNEHVMEVKSWKLKIKG
jgi:hypothetical protein